MKPIYFYISPAMPPLGIKINKPYEVTLVGDIYTVEGIEFQKEIFNQLFEESKQNEVTKNISTEIKTDISVNPINTSTVTPITQNPVEKPVG